ncbi:TetR/AcrR family transcriptional regulator [Actinoplanes solisilvae]|uniref:TetR/AcrR family transcriptional regulator n=1 Tax=Actinoplanes solisilvae TaxID=2486853 RepID=UPI000FDBAE6B|nr:TetR/AcrR family transcriptional regulator [Actinoplanes solisilvae]
MTATRRHGAELVDAIHQAVLAEMAEHGYAGTTYEGVAARAGTSKTVLYRRWPRKAEMALDALMESSPDPVIPADTGSLSGDLKALLRAMHSTMERAGRQTMLSLLAELDRPAAELLFIRGSAFLEPLLARARGRGELGPGAVPPRMVTMALDLVRHEVLIVGSLTEDSIDMIVDEMTIPLLRARSMA